MSTDIFKTSRKSIPRQDKRIVRIPLDEQELGGRKSHLEQIPVSNEFSIKHVGNTK